MKFLVALRALNYYSFIPLFIFKGIDGLFNQTNMFTLLFFFIWITLDNWIPLHNNLKDLKQVNRWLNSSPQCKGSYHRMDDLIRFSQLTPRDHFVSQQFLWQVITLCKLIKVIIFETLNFQVFQIIIGQIQVLRISYCIQLEVMLYKGFSYQLKLYYLLSDFCIIDFAAWHTIYHCQGESYHKFTRLK